MIKLYKPNINDLWFKEKIVNDPLTMSFNHATLSFPKDRWGKWYDKWFNDDNRYYRYIEVDNEFVGECSYYLNNDKYYIDVIVLYDKRNKGYGSYAIKQLCSIAKQNNIKELYDEIYNDNPSINLFIKNGFSIVSKDNESTLIKITL